MEQKLNVINIEKKNLSQVESVIYKNSLALSSPFILDTCKRYLIVDSHPLKRKCCSVITPSDFEVYKNEKAYAFLLEILCGLHSDILGENEITHQFKKEFQQYIRKKNRNSKLIRVFEKLLKDSKIVRTDHLKGLTQNSYSSIAKQILIKKSSNSKVLIIGSGQLAGDLIKVLKKKFDLVVSARNEKIMQNLEKEYGVGVAKWKNFSHYNSFSNIICCIGTNEILFSPSFFHSWKIQHLEDHNPHCFIDFGNPSSICTSLNKTQGVYRLADIFNLGKDLNIKKKSKIEKAQLNIKKLASYRFDFTDLLPQGKIH